MALTPSATPTLALGSGFGFGSGFGSAGRRTCTTASGRGELEVASGGSTRRRSWQETFARQNPLAGSLTCTGDDDQDCGFFFCSLLSRSNNVVDTLLAELQLEP